jgi:LysR family glycine cleavage system transcriptional activator
LLDAAVQRVAGGDDAHRLRFKVPPTFAMKWLMPRLPHFQVLHPQVELSLSTSIQPADFDTENIDISMLRAAEPDPSLHSVPVLEERLLLVCSPKLWGRRRARLSALNGMTVLHTVNRRDDWDVWLRQAGAGEVRPGNQLEFGFSLLMYQAAVEGLGVAVAQPELVQDELASGRLTAPFDAVFSTGRRYFLICPESRRRAEAVSRFLEWVAATGAATPSVLGSPGSPPSRG